MTSTCNLFDPHVGEVVLARCFNPFEDPRTAGKVRPMILWARKSGHYLAMGLTTKPIYRSGRPRVPIPDPAAIGLHGPGYLWGSRLTAISALDVLQPIGQATPQVIDLVRNQIRFLGPKSAAER